LTFSNLYVKLLNKMAILLDASKAKSYPLIPLRSGVIFPQTEVVLTFGRPRSIDAIKTAFAKDRLIVLVSQKSSAVVEPTPNDIHRIGTLARIERMFKTEKEINTLVKGLGRVEIISYEATQPYFVVRVMEMVEEIEKSEQVTALCNHLTSQLKEAVNLGKKIEFLTFMEIMSGLSPAAIADQIAFLLDIKQKEKQELLETVNVKERLEKVVQYFAKELRVLDLERKIAIKTQKKFDKSVKETVLRERIKTMEKELGEGEESRETKEYLAKIKKAEMPKQVEEKAKQELKRLSQMSSYNPEASYLRTYLDWLTELPWNKRSVNNVEIKTAQKILEADHYGLKPVKERILEYLAVMKLKNQRKKQLSPEEKNGEKESAQPTILCFVGPPGVGKTSIGRSIARALGRKFVKMSLGGIRDEAEIRGHRRTYVGALPGRIIQGIKQAETRNPVFMLDEIDKVGADFRGDPSAALLEALDPEQNYSFQDHYLDVAFNLSDVFFITTCNVLDTIPPALKDRLEIIHFPGYTENEKFQIGKSFLIKKQLEAHGLSDQQVMITNFALRRMIRDYTREAGVRNLEREIAALFRKAARKFAEGRKKRIDVGVAELQKFLGPTKYTSYLAEKKDETGMATGLAWTEAGGDILFIEVALMSGSGKLILTGHLGEVMQESCKAALSYVRSRWQLFGLLEKFYQKLDIHVHVPEGAVPKDGPSAGTAITTALVSALTKTAVRKEVGMTGEVTLRGRVLEIGGVKEKVIAAHRAKLKTIIMPKKNEKDLEDIPKNVLKDLKFVFVDHLDEVLKVALKKMPILKEEKEIISPRLPKHLHATLVS